jgi:predicted RNase H-like HicB family nuclease
MFQITLDIRRLDEGPYLGASPDLPGLVVQAATAEEVVRLAPEIARELIEVMIETAQPLPESLGRITSPMRVPLVIPA